MNDITTSLMRYRECSRSLWNIYLLDRFEEVGWDLIDDFHGLTGVLFDRLVARGPAANIIRSKAEQTSPYIRIIPREGGAPIMINRPSTDGCNYWDDPVREVLPTDVDMQFVDFFDWQINGIRDFRYYEILIREFDKHPDRIGRKALIEVNYATAELIHAT